MEKQKILDQIKGGLIVSCQALEHEPLYTKEGGIMPLMAKAAAQSGAVGIRANTVRDITQIKEVVALPVIGIIKKDYEGTPMYITVTMKEVDALVACGVDIVAVQGTGARRPDGSSAPEFIRAVKEKYPQQLVWQTVRRWKKESHVPRRGLILWVLRCVATHRRQKDATISIMHLSMNFPKNVLQRSLQRDISITRNRQKKRWKRVHLPW